MLIDQVERQQRVAQMVEHAHEDDEVKAFVEHPNVINRQIPEFDVKAIHFCGEASLSEIFVASVQPEHPLGAATLHFNSIEAGVAPDVEDRFSFQACRDHIRKVAPFYPRVVAQEMRRRRSHAGTVKVMKARPLRSYPTADLVL